MTLLFIQMATNHMRVEQVVFILIPLMTLQHIPTIAPFLDPNLPQKHLITLSVHLGEYLDTVIGQIPKYLREDSRTFLKCLGIWPKILDKAYQYIFYKLSDIGQCNCASPVHSNRYWAI